LESNQKAHQIQRKIPPFQQQNGQLAITYIDKANIFASQLAETFQPHSGTVPENDSFVKIHKLFLSTPLSMRNSFL